MAKSERNLVCPGIMSLLKGQDFGWSLYCCLQVHLLLELYRLQGNITRVKINELKPLKPRFEVPDVLIAEPPTEPWVCLWSESAQWHSENSWTYAWFIVFLWVTSARLCCLVFASDSPVSLCFSLFSSLSVLSKDDNGLVLSLGAESQRLIVSAHPFRLDIMEGPEVLLSLNSRGLLAFEHLRLSKETWVLSFSLLKWDLFGSWEEYLYTTFGSVMFLIFCSYTHQGCIYLIQINIYILI